MMHIPIMSWEALFAVTQKQQSAIEKYADEIVALRVENERLRTAGRELVSDSTRFSFYGDFGWQCEECDARSSEAPEAIEHEKFCPVLVFQPDLTQ